MVPVATRTADVHLRGWQTAPVFDPALWRLFFSPIDRADKQAMMYDLVIGTVYGESRTQCSTGKRGQTWIA